MAEQKKVRIIVERQDGPKEKPYNQELESTIVRASTSLLP